MSYLDITQQLSKIAQEFKQAANSYKEERAIHAEATNKLTGLIYKTGIYEDKASFENKLTKLLATSYAEEAKKYIEMLNISEANYKGWEMVCKALGAEISAIQSVIKYNLTGEVNENIANKIGGFNNGIC
jgi:hypothetical protein